MIGDVPFVSERIQSQLKPLLTQAIGLAEGNQARASRWLGLSRFTLREKLKQLGLHPDAADAGSEKDG